MEELDPALVVSLTGLLAGCVLGLAARLGRFCTMGAVEDAVYGGDLGRIRMVALAAATGIAATTLLISMGGLDPDLSRLRQPGWSPLSAVLGGVMFGYGMALVGTCGFGALARAGGGDLRSLLIVAVVGIAAYAGQSGPLSPLRLWLQPEAGTEGHLPGLDAEIGGALGVPDWSVAVVAAAALAGFALWSSAARRHRRRLFWGAAVGLAVTLGWAVTGWGAFAGFDVIPVESLSFTAPPGEAVLALMTGSVAVLPGFGIASVIGVLLGAAVGAVLRGEWRWEACDDAGELRRQVTGAVLMGLGGVLALGCTIGQGLSAMSILAPGAPVVVISVLVGARLGLYVLVEGVAFQR